MSIVERLCCMGVVNVDVDVVGEVVGDVYLIKWCVASLRSWASKRRNTVASKATSRYSMYMYVCVRPGGKRN